MPSHYEDSRPIPESAQDLFQQLNQELFGGELPDIPCSWNDRLSTLGVIHYRGIKVGRWGDRMWHDVSNFWIELRKGRSARAVRKTLCHEMCHAWELLNFGRGGHDPNFWRKMVLCGYPKDHAFHDELNEEGDYYSGKERLRQQRKSRRASVEAEVTVGGRVATPWGGATVVAIEPGRGNRITRLTIRPDPLTAAMLSRPVGALVIVKATQCSPVSPKNV